MLTPAWPWALLFPAYALLWWPQARAWAGALLAGGLAAAAWEGQLDPLAALPLALLGLSGRLLRHERRALGHLLFVALAVALSLHVAPGFHNPLVIDGPLKADAVAWRMYLNLDKPLLAWWVLLVTAPPLARGLRCTLRTALAGGLGASLICLGLAWLMGAIAWAPGWPSHSLIWWLNNALLVTLAEEALFRGYIQQQLTPRLGPWQACLIAALLFGLAHAAGGPLMVALAGLAGLAYGWAYQRAGLAAAVLAHLLLNTLHFWLFTYPLAA